MKEKISEINPKKGTGKLVRILKFFPFNPDRFESEILRYRNNTNINHFWIRFWVSIVIDRLESAGYSIFFKLETIYDYRDFHNSILKIAEKILHYLSMCEKKPKKDVYHANHEYLSIRVFFHILITSLSMEQDGNWTKLHSRSKPELWTLFRSVFGFYHANMPVDWILTPEGFITRINDILKELNYGQFAILADGEFRYIGVTAEAEEIKRAYSLLTDKNYDSVIKILNAIDDTKNSDIEHKENICLDLCRNALESFYKSML